MTLRRRLIALALASLAAFSSVEAQGAPPQSSDSAEAFAERMLTAIGGRAAWARTTNTINDSQQNRAGEPTVVRAVITMDFMRPRFRIEITGPNLHVVRVIDGDRNWRLTRAGTIDVVPDTIVAEDLRWYAGHVYRTLHRIASRDPALTLSVNQRGRLEVHERGARIAWFAVDARGEPYAFGAHADDVGSISGPWEFERGGVRHPTWVSSPDGTWRAAVRSLEVNVRLDDAIFARPARE
jgi:hypothetical protein